MSARLPLVLIVLCSVSAVRADEADAIRAVEKLGGKIQAVDPKTKSVTGVDFAYAKKLTDEDLGVLAEFPELRSVNLWSTPIGDDAIRELAKVRRLERLCVAHTAVTGKGLKQLAGLKELSLDACPMGNEAMKEVGTLTELTYLRLVHCKSVGDEGIARLVELKKLDNLDLTGTAITDNGMRSVGRLRTLRTLTLFHTKIGDKGVAELATLSSLHTLGLSFTEVKGPGLAKLAGLKHLFSIDLTRTKVDDVGLQELAVLTQVRYIWAGGDGVTVNGIEKLRQKLPGCKLSR
jgi:hypothetical protein